MAVYEPIIGSWIVASIVDDSSYRDLLSYKMKPTEDLPHMPYKLINKCDI